MNKNIAFELSFVEFARNASDANLGRMLSWVSQLMSHFPILYVDLFAANDDIFNSFPHFLNHEDDLRQVGKGDWWKMANFFGIRAIDRYISYRVVKPTELETLWKHYLYSTPKMYRFSSTNTANFAPTLPTDLIDDFQYCNMRVFEDLLSKTPLILRDGIDEMGLESLVAKNVSNIFHQSLELLS